MITEYTCKNADCSNFEIVYRMEDAPNGCMCGGCREWMMPNE